MNLSRLTLIALLAAACGPAVADAPEAAVAPPGAQAGPMGEGGHGGGFPGGFPAAHRRGRGPGPSSLHGVVLDDAQDDKVFAILHALAPQRREQSRILRQSEDALRALGVSGQYDENKAAALAKAAGAAMAALALMDARSEARILAVLTPEQRRQAEDARARRHPRFDN